MNAKLNPLENNHTMFIWFRHIEGQRPWDNYLYINIPPNKFKSFNVATMLQPGGSKVMGVLNVYKPGVDPDGPGFQPHMYWHVDNDKEYAYNSIFLPEPGKYTLVVRGDKRFEVDGIKIVEGPKGNERWSGYVALLGIEFVTVNNQTIPFQDGFAEGFSWSYTPQPGISLPQFPPPPPLPQPGSGSSSSSSPQPAPDQSASQPVPKPSRKKSKKARAPEPPPPQVVYVPVPEKKKKRSCLGRIGCMILICIGLAVAAIAFLTMLGPSACNFLPFLC